MTAQDTTPVLNAFLAQGMRPTFHPQPDSVEAVVTIAGERYRGYSAIDNEHALRDLLGELPEHANLRVSRALHA